jgi:hypothetical protein
MFIYIHNMILIIVRMQLIYLNYKNILVKGKALIYYYPRKNIDYRGIKSKLFLFELFLFKKFNILIIIYIYIFR